MAKPNYKQIFAKKKEKEDIIKKICPKASHTSGIYGFFREDEIGFKFGYVGQATKSLLSRMADHLLGYQHIDLSIKRHGLYDMVNNPHGYKACILIQCPAHACDELEQHYIKEYANAGYQMRNKTGGSQHSNKVGIADNRPSRGYRDGLVQGELNLKRKLNDIISKYLTIGLKKEGKLAENALNKFWILLSEQEPEIKEETEEEN